MPSTISAAVFDVETDTYEPTPDDAEWQDTLLSKYSKPTIFGLFAWLALKLTLHTDTVPEESQAFSDLIGKMPFRETCLISFAMYGQSLLRKHSNTLSQESRDWLMGRVKEFPCRYPDSEDVIKECAKVKKLLELDGVSAAPEDHSEILSSSAASIETNSLSKGSRWGGSVWKKVKGVAVKAGSMLVGDETAAFQAAVQFVHHGTIGDGVSAVKVEESSRDESEE